VVEGRICRHGFAYLTGSNNLDDDEAIAALCSR
jgi:hypothetical protein